MYRRRTALKAVGTGVFGMLAGCSAPGDDGTSGEATAVTSGETTPFLTRSSLPEWYPDGDGLVVLVGSDDRAEALLDSYDIPEDREATVRELLSGIDYGDERLLLVESVGPSACHDRLELSAFELDDGTLRAEATVIDTATGDVDCAAVEQYPSALARVGFDGVPPEAASVRITDGRGDTATVSSERSG